MFATDITRTTAAKKIRIALTTMIQLKVHSKMSTPVRYLENVVNWVLLTFLSISFTANVYPDDSGHRTCYVLLYKDDTNFRETKAFFSMNSMHLSVSLETAGFTRQI